MKRKLRFNHNDLVSEINHENIILFRKFIWEGYIGESEEKDTGTKKSKKKAARDFKVNYYVE